MRRPLLAVGAIVALAGSPGWAAADLVLDGEVPVTPTRYFEIPFTVPSGVAELEVAHTGSPGGVILDWGLEDPSGFRGYGGGNRENVVLATSAATRSYLPGPIPAGQWKVTVGEADVSGPASYHVEITFRSAQTLAAQPERRPYVPVAPLSSSARWYAGDFHVHSMESGDARPTLDQVAAVAKARGLDFIHLSDHNTTSQLQFMGDLQARNPGLLFLPGAEWTSYWGHASAVGATAYVSPRIGHDDLTIGDVVDAYHGMDALFSINHPSLDLGTDCIGCAWTLDIPATVDGVEIETGGFYEDGFLFGQGAVAFWDGVCARGIHAKALGGSDDHTAGVEEDRTSSTIGSPTTMVFADELSVDGMLRGIRAGRTVVKTDGPGGPMIDFTATGDAQQEDTVVAASTVKLKALITGADGLMARWVQNGVPQPAVRVEGEPFLLEKDVPTPALGEDHWRAEVLIADQPHVITSHLWVAQGFGRAGTVLLPDVDRVSPCGCGAAEGLLWASLLPVLAVVLRRRRARQ